MPKRQRSAYAVLAAVLALGACAGAPTTSTVAGGPGNPSIACGPDQLICSGKWGNGCYVGGANSCFEGKVCPSGQALCVSGGKADCYNPVNNACR